MDEQTAIEAARPMFGRLDSGSRLFAMRLDSLVELWTVNAADAQGLPWAGSQILVGPDGKVWSFSSNPGIHEQRIVVDALVGIYEAQLATAVDVGALADRIELATRRARDECKAILADAAAGELRGRRRRELP